jgi:cell division protein FtsB
MRPQGSAGGFGSCRIDAIYGEQIGIKWVGHSKIKSKQAEMSRLKRENVRIEEEVAFLQNRLPGKPAPYAKKQFALR